MDISKQDRQGLILEYMKVHPQSSQKEIQKFINAKIERYFSQSTISRDITEIGYELVNGEYRQKEDLDEQEKRHLLEGVIKRNSLAVNVFPLPENKVETDAIQKQGRQLYTIIIKCHRGFEGTIAGLLYDLWSTRFRAVIPGIGSVVIYTNSAKNARNITATLRRYSRGQSEYVILENDVSTD